MQEQLKRLKTKLFIENFISNPMEIQELTDLNYNDFINTTNSCVFIDFFSENCPPCQSLLTLLPHLREQYKNENVVIAKVNVAQNPKLAAKYMVRSVPLTVVVGEDKMVKKAEIGLKDLGTYSSMIDLALGKKKSFFSKFFGE